jgi:Tfp pilus assembly protein PilN
MNSINGTRLLASQVIPIALEIEKAELDEFVAQVVTRNFPGVSPTETPLFSCFAAARLPFTVSAERDLQALATLQFGLNEGDVLPPPTLPALGAALQAIGEGNDGINLLPEERRARREKRLSPFTLALVGAIGMLGIVWATVAIFQQHRILRDLARQRAALEAPVQQVQTQEEEIAQLQKQLQLLDGAGRQKVIPVLKGLSELFPREYYLNHLRYKEGDIEMSGLGSRSAADLLAQLENSPCFRDVTAKAPFTTTPQGETFTLGAKTELCRE